MNSEHWRTLVMLAALTAVVLLASSCAIAHMADGQPDGAPASEPGAASNNDGTEADLPPVNYVYYTINGEAATKDVQILDNYTELSPSYEDVHLKPGNYRVKDDLWYRGDMEIQGPAILVVSGESVLGNVRISGHVDICVTEETDNLVQFDSLTGMSPDASLSLHGIKASTLYMENLELNSFRDPSTSTTNPPVSLLFSNYRDTREFAIVSSSVNVYGGTIQLVQYNGVDLITDDTKMFCGEQGRIEIQPVGNQSITGGYFTIAEGGELYISISGGNKGISRGTFDVDGTLRVDTWLNQPDAVAISGGEFIIDGTLDMRLRSGTGISGGEFRINTLNMVCGDSTGYVSDENGIGIAGGTVIVNGTANIETHNHMAGIDGGTVILQGTTVITSTAESIGIKDGEVRICNGLILNAEGGYSTGIGGGTVAINGNAELNINNACTGIGGGNVSISGNVTMTLEYRGIGIGDGNVKVDGNLEMNAMENSIGIKGGTLDLYGDVKVTTDENGVGIKLASGEINYLGNGIANLGHVDLEPADGETAYLNIYGGTVNANIIDGNVQGARTFIDGGVVTIDYLESNTEIVDGYVYVPNKIDCAYLKVSGGGALFCKQFPDPSKDHSEYGTEMMRYDLSQVYRQLGLYAEAYREGVEGYPYVIDHIHNEEGYHHDIGTYDHYHCSVPRYTGDMCDFTPIEETHDFYIQDNGDDTHSVLCRHCDYNETSSHVYGTAEDLGNGYHSYTCIVCQHKGEEEHVLDKPLSHNMHHLVRCKYCTYSHESEGVLDVVPGEPHHTYHCSECEYSWPEDHTYSWTDNGDGTHTGTCTVCGYQLETEEHHYVNGVCDKCDAIHPGLIGGGVDDYYPPVWGYDEIQDVGSKEKEEWIAIAVAATAATIMAVFLIWDRRRGP